MRTSPLRRALAVLAVLASVVLGTACVDALVGAECAPGYVQCGSRCIDVLSDPANCNACGVVCEDGVCGDGRCGASARVDGGPRDGSVLDARSSDGSLGAGDAGDADVVDGAALDGEAVDGGALDGAVPTDGAVVDGAPPTDGAALDGAAAIDGAFDAAAVDGSGSADAAIGEWDLAGLDLGSAALDADVVDLGGEELGGADLGAADLGDADLGPVVCDLGELVCGRVCVRPDRDPQHCGACGVRCGLGELCVEGACTPLCAAPLTFCSGLCVDLASDPDHCGGCAIRCPSGICTDGACVDAPAGHIVVVGHDYVTRRVGMSRIAGNAVFLGSGNPVRVLAYAGSAAATSIAGTDAAISQVATARGRPWRRSLVAAGEVPLRLGSTDVFLVYAQAGASDAVLQGLGVQWSVALRTFLRHGGVVVVFETPTENAGTWQILEPAGLLASAACTLLSSGTLRVVAPGDAVAIDVPLMYSVERNTVRLGSTDGTAVVADSLGAVVLHEVVTGP